MVEENPDANAPTRSPPGEATPIEAREVVVDDDTVTLREYRSDDYERLVSMYVDFPLDQRAMGIPPLGGRARIETWVDRLVERGRNVVAVNRESVVGHAVLTPATDPKPELAVFVSPAAQNRGVGTGLCELLVEIARPEGYEALTLRVVETNRRALRVYEKLGFSTTSNPPEKNWRAMERRLDRVEDESD